MKTGMSEEIILACLLHDCVLSLIKPDHGWWGASSSSRTFRRRARSRFAITRRCASTPTTMPVRNIRTRYYRIFGHDYQPPQYIADTYKMLKNHKR